MDTKFIVDNNAGKLAKWLRIMGYDTLLFKEADDGKMINVALSQDRIILTRDTQILKRRLVTSGRLKVIFIEEDNPKAQLKQVVTALNLSRFKPFSLCLECNQELVSRNKGEVSNLVPPYVFKTQNQYMECPSCHRIYWQGTHWQAMSRELRKFFTKGGELNERTVHL